MLLFEASNGHPNGAIVLHAHIGTYILGCKRRGEIVELAVAGTLKPAFVHRPGYHGEGNDHPSRSLEHRWGNVGRYVPSSLQSRDARTIVATILGITQSNASKKTVMLGRRTSCGGCRPRYITIRGAVTEAACAKCVQSSIGERMTSFCRSTARV